MGQVYFVFVKIIVVCGLWSEPACVGAAEGPLVTGQTTVYSVFTEVMVLVVTEGVNELAYIVLPAWVETGVEQGT